MTYLGHSNPTEAEIREELSLTFASTLGDSANKAFLESCVKVSVFLADTPRVTEHLKRLELQLQQQAGNALDQVIKHYRDRAAALTTVVLEDNLRHLLARELTKLEIHHGFNTFSCLGKERVQSYVKFVAPDAFRAQLKLGRHWKDPGVPGEHGEYTHRIQWYLLTDAIAGQILAPVELFMRIGAIVDPNPGNSPSGLWDALFDRNDGAASTSFKVQKDITDCRCPESLTRFIVNDQNAGQWPLLHWYIKARLYKRKVSPLNDFWGAKRYVDKKVKAFGLNTLDPETVIKKGFRNKMLGSGILEPGPAVTRTQPLV